jgi:hypothetical protein
MPVIRTVLKKVRQQAVVKIVGNASAGSSDGTANIGPLELKLTDETLDLPNVQMNITGIMWTTPGAFPIVITRNNSTVMILNGNDNWSTSQMFGFADTSNNSANITVTMPANSTIYLHISKPAGFIEPDQQTKK